MATIYDLSLTLRPINLDTRDMEMTRVPHDEAARIFAREHGVRVSQLPRASFFATERVSMGSHDGSHLDAPYHFYPLSEGKPARRLDQVPLEWAFADAVALDFRDKPPSEHITEYDVAAELERVGYTIKPDDIVMLWTGGTDDFDTDPHFHVAAAGLNGAALNYLFSLGVRVMSSDSATMDMPIPLMNERLKSGHPDDYFPVHRAGKLKDWTHAEKLGNMGCLPGPHGFKVMFFPVKIRQATGAWCRAVAVQDDWLDGRDVQLVDLSVPLMNHSFEPDPTHVRTLHHDQTIRRRAKLLGLTTDRIVHWGAMDEVETSTHAGTHVDAPYHFAPMVGWHPARTVDELPLDWLYGDAVLLDFTRTKQPGDAISAADLQAELDRVGHTLQGSEIVLLRTGAADRFEDDPRFPELGMALERAALDWLLDRGVRVIGCDAESLDGPVGPMLEALRAGRPDEFFPVSCAGRYRELCVIKKMDLRGLRHPTGFKVAALPIKLEKASAAWCRAVALVP